MMTVRALKSCEAVWSSCQAVLMNDDLIFTQSQASEKETRAEIAKIFLEFKSSRLFLITTNHNYRNQLTCSIM